MASYLPPRPPIDPSIRVGTVDGDRRSPPVLRIVRPDAVNRLATESVSINQATGIRPVVWIVFDNFTVENTDQDLVERQMICFGFFIGMVGNPYAVVAYRVDDVIYVHPRPSLSADRSC